MTKVGRENYGHSETVGHKAPMRPTQLQDTWHILWKPLSEIPYSTPSDRAATVAGVLTGILRKGLSRAPAFAFTGPATSGKTVLATCIAELAGGSATVLGGSKEEYRRKQILSALRKGQSSILLDDISGDFASEAVDELLGLELIAEKAIGEPDPEYLPTKVLVLITGSNFTPRGDLWRRIVTARIDPRVEHAERRSFRLDARKHCREHRQALVAAGLTLLDGFVAAGKPRFTTDRLVSFEEWDNLIRQCVLWLNDQGIAELGDPIASIKDAEQAQTRT